MICREMRKQKGVINEMKITKLHSSGLFQPGAALLQSSPDFLLKAASALLSAPKALSDIAVSYQEE